VACRVHLKDSAGKPVQPKGLPFWNDHFVCSGEVELPLADGEYTYEIDRGPEYFITSGKLSVTESKSLSVTNRLQRMVDLTKEGWWSGELHIHRPLSDIELLMRAEDLHLAPTMTWWNARNSWLNQPLPANPLVRFDKDRFYQVMAGEDERGAGRCCFFNLAHR